MDGRLKVALCFAFCLGSVSVVLLVPDFGSALIGWFAGALGCIIGLQFLS